MCESFNLQHGTNYIAVMPTNLYGPNDNFDLERSHVLPAMIRKIYLGKCLSDNKWIEIKADLKKRPVEGINENSLEDEIIDILNKYGINKGNIKLWGTGEPLREFLWSEDMADASVFVMENINFSDTYIADEKEIRNCHINIGSGSEISIRELSEIIAKVIAYTGKISFDSSKPNGTMRKLTDVSKLNSLGWKHKVDINEGVKRMFDWYISN